MASFFICYTKFLLLLFFVCMLLLCLFFFLVIDLLMFGKGKFLKI